MTPDWNKAPMWAQYVAMDANGEWWWYEFKPTPIKGEEYFLAVGKHERAILRHSGWKKSIQQRPQPKQEKV